METAEAGVTGEPPVLTIRERTHEQAKYETMWTHPQYRTVAPGEELVARFLQWAAPPAGAEVIDFGAGTGRGALALALLGLNVHAIDFANNCLDAKVLDVIRSREIMLSFLVHDLNRPLPFHVVYGYCTDVMEHVPPEEVDRVLVNILAAAQFVFFQISCDEDSCGALIDQPLHLSVHDYAWWRAKFEALEVKVISSEDHGDRCLFYVTAWQTGEEFSKTGTLNVTEETIRANVAKNIAAGWQMATPKLVNDQEAILIAGGPSLNDPGILDKIKALRDQGAGTITMNGAYTWAIEHGVIPGAQIVCDARPFNKRFVEPILSETKYLMASQCDPSTLEGLPPERTWVWHTSAENIRDILDQHLQPWFGVPGGCTVLMRAIPLLHMLGFRRFHLFGADSCLRLPEGSVVAQGETGSLVTHHAYTQPENDGQYIMPVNVGGKIFYCHPWMANQAQDFLQLIRVAGEDFELEVYGEGLLSWIISHAASIDLARELAEEPSGEASSK